MSGGCRELSAKTILDIYDILGEPNKRPVIERMLCGKVRNRIETLLGAEKTEFGLRIFLALDPVEFDLVDQQSGKPVLDPTGSPARGFRYSQESLRKTFRLEFDSRERNAMLQLLQSRIERDDANGEIAASSLKAAGWLGMVEELEKRMFAAYKPEEFSGELDKDPPA